MFVSFNNKKIVAIEVKLMHLCSISIGPFDGSFFELTSLVHSYMRILAFVAYFTIANISRNQQFFF